GSLRCLQEQHVPRILIKCLFKQLLAFVDAQLFNQLLLRPDCCCASNARHVLSGLRLLDQWLVVGAGDGLMRALYQELRHIRQGRTVVEVLRMLDTPQLYAPLALPSHL
ncbi:dilute domain-containing protein, partial [Haematococcus lacustris]